jgi:beta-N-acetylhexosaminidase
MSIADRPSQRSSLSSERTSVDGYEEAKRSERPVPLHHTFVQAPPESYEQYSINPPPVAPLQFKRPKRGLLGVFILVTLVLLTLVVAAGSLFGSRMFTGAPAQPTPTLLAVTGPFVQPPLNPAQINSIKHLVTYMQYKQLASLYVSRMTLDEELGQLIMVEYAEDYYSPQLDMMVNQLHAGGVIMYEFQMKTFAQTKHDIAEMQRRAQIPLLISTDEEGGPYIHRLSHIYPPRPSATDIAATGDPNVAVQQANRVAHELLALGINENLAPDVDVNLVNGYDMVDRTFGNTPQGVIKFASPYLQTLQGDGVVGCIKHFPGLGDAVPDAHTTLPVVKRTRDQIYSVELAPFKYFIQSQNKLENPGMVMPTDVLMPAIDPVYPAELSHIFITDILRKQFGFDGVVLTDALYMAGISEKWSMPEAAVLALNAGNDMLLGPTDSDQMIEMLNGLKAALQNGTLSKARVDEAATRIIALKMQFHLMPAVVP